MKKTFIITDVNGVHTNLIGAQLTLKEIEPSQPEKTLDEKMLYSSYCGEINIQRAVKIAQDHYKDFVPKSEVLRVFDEAVKTENEYGVRQALSNLNSEVR